MNSFPSPCNSFNFCNVEGESSPVENLGQVLFGERIRPSPYKVRRSPCRHGPIIATDLVRFPAKPRVPTSLYTKVLVDRSEGAEVLQTLDERHGAELPATLDRGQYAGDALLSELRAEGVLLARISHWLLCDKKRSLERIVPCSKRKERHVLRLQSPGFRDHLPQWRGCVRAFARLDNESLALF